MFKELSNMASMLRQAQQMGGKMQEISARLKSKRVTGSAGGGMVVVEANGHGEVLKVKIDPTLSGDLEMIEDLVPAAMNQVAAKAKELHIEMMQSVASDLQLPGLDEAISKLTDGGPIPF
jgi:DNA-binding YbaB/EbfC family protein